MSPSFLSSQRISCDQAFFSRGKRKQKSPKQKGKKYRLIAGYTQRTNVTHKLSAEIFTSTSTASREILAQRPTLTPGWAKNTLINCMWYRSRFEQSWFSSQLSSLFPGGGGYSWEFLVGACRPVLQILTLFLTKKCNFPHPFPDQTRNYVIIIYIRAQTKKFFKSISNSHISLSFLLI